MLNKLRHATGRVPRLGGHLAFLLFFAETLLVLTRQVFLYSESSGELGEKVLSNMFSTFGFSGRVNLMDLLMGSTDPDPSEDATTPSSEMNSTHEEDYSHNDQHFYDGPVHYEDQHHEDQENQNHEDQNHECDDDHNSDPNAPWDRSNCAWWDAFFDKYMETCIRAGSSFGDCDDASDELTWGCFDAWTEAACAQFEPGPLGDRRRLVRPRGNRTRRRHGKQDEEELRGSSMKRRRAENMNGETESNWPASGKNNSAHNATDGGIVFMQDMDSLFGGTWSPSGGSGTGANGLGEMDMFALFGPFLNGLFSVVLPVLTAFWLVDSVFCLLFDFDYTELFGELFNVVSHRQQRIKDCLPNCEQLHEAFGEPNVETFLMALLLIMPVPDSLAFPVLDGAFTVLFALDVLLLLPDLHHMSLLWVALTMVLELYPFNQADKTLLLVGGVLWALFLITDDRPQVFVKYTRGLTQAERSAWAGDGAAELVCWRSLAPCRADNKIFWSWWGFVNYLFGSSVMLQIWAVGVALFFCANTVVFMLMLCLPLLFVFSVLGGSCRGYRSSLVAARLVETLETGAGFVLVTPLGEYSAEAASRGDHPLLRLFQCQRKNHGLRTVLSETGRRVAFWSLLFLFVFGGGLRPDIFLSIIGIIVVGAGGVATPVCCHCCWVQCVARQGVGFWFRALTGVDIWAKEVSARSPVGPPIIGPPVAAEWMKESIQTRNYRKEAKVACAEEVGVRRDKG